MVMYHINFKDIHLFKLNLFSGNQKLAIFHVYQGCNSWLNRRITFYFELNLYSVDGQVPYKFQQNRIKFEERNPNTLSECLMKQYLGDFGIRVMTSQAILGHRGPLVLFCNSKLS